MIKWKCLNMILKCDWIFKLTNLHTKLHTNLHTRKKFLAKHKLSRYKHRELKRIKLLKLQKNHGLLHSFDNMSFSFKISFILIVVDRYPTWTFRFNYNVKRTCTKWSGSVGENEMGPNPYFIIVLWYSTFYN